MPLFSYQIFQRKWKVEVSHAGDYEYYIFLESDATLSLRNLPMFQLNRAASTIYTHSPLFSWTFWTDVSSLFAIVRKNVTLLVALPMIIKNILLLSSRLYFSSEHERFQWRLVGLSYGGVRASVIIWWIRRPNVECVLPQSLNSVCPVYVAALHFITYICIVLDNDSEV